MSEVNTLVVVNVVSGGVNQEPPSPAWPRENDPARQACTSTGRTWSSQTSQLTRSARPTPLRPFTPLSPTVLVLVESDLDRGGVGVGVAARGLGEGALLLQVAVNVLGGKMNRTCTDSAFVLHS